MSRGKNGSGNSGIEPFRTYLRFSIAPNALKRKARKIGLKTVYFNTYDISSTDWLKKKKLARGVYKITRDIFRVVSFNKIDCSEYIVVLKKTCL